MSTPLPSMDEVVKIWRVNVHSVIYSSQAKSTVSSVADGNSIKCVPVLFLRAIDELDGHATR